MYERINERISAELVCDTIKGIIMPRRMRWQGRIFTMTSLAYHHKIRIGRTIVHVFHVTDGTMDFRISLNTDTLQWTLEEVADGTTPEQNRTARHAYRYQ